MKLLQHIRSLPNYLRSSRCFLKYPPGHYYSLVPDIRELGERIENLEEDEASFPDIDFCRESQLALLKRFAEFYGDIPFTEERSSNGRYFYNQGWFCYADAIFLYSFLRNSKPSRVLEVGSGYSTAVMLDSRDSLKELRFELSCIEPHPERLRSILRPGDKLEIIEERLQSIEPSVFQQLQAGDLLFIDSSHVLKTGSDLQFLMNRVLPFLADGVYVHFHDVFFPFEYPVEWLRQGRYWNECYFLRCFLSHNSNWRIHFFNHYLGLAFKDFISENMPLCSKNLGGSLYLEKRSLSS